jgi:hypothetical protein
MKEIMEFINVKDQMKLVTNQSKYESMVIK